MRKWGIKEFDEMEKKRMIEIKNEGKNERTRQRKGNGKYGRRQKVRWKIRDYISGVCVRACMSLNKSSFACVCLYAFVWIVIVN